MRYSFEDCELDLECFELRRGGAVVPVEPQVLEVLGYLVSNAGRLVSRDELIRHVWPEGFIGDAALSSRLMAARKAIGDSGREQRLIKTIHGRGFRFVGAVSEIRGGPERGPATGVGEAELAMPPAVRYAQTSDGYRIAYAVTGDGPPLVRALGWFTHLELEWRWPGARRFWERIAGDYQLIRYDGRGMGLSDPAEDFPLEARVEDLRAVVDSLGLERFALLGMSEGALTAVQFAAEYPGRVTHLITYGYGPEPDPEASRAWTLLWKSLINVIRNGWGSDIPVYRRMFAELFLGKQATADTVRYFDELQSASASAETAVRYLRQIDDSRVLEAAARVRCPALVIHRRDDTLIPFERSRQLAAHMPGAEFLTLEGDAHWLLYDDPGASMFTAAVQAFLSRPAGSAAAC